VTAFTLDATAPGVPVLGAVAARGFPASRALA